VLLTPRYGDRPVVAVDTRSPGPHPVVQQRRRLQELLADLPPDDWQRPSRCAGWSVQDVVTHLVSTNGFWTLSIQAGLAGEPTRFLGSFDPVATPAQLVDQVQGTPVADTLQQLSESNEALAAAVEALDEDGWATLAEAPPGHVPIRLVADHALWDAWVHERDILLPLGRTPVEDADEVRTCLRYGAALGTAFALCAGGAPSTPVALSVHDPDLDLVVTVDGDVVRVHDGPPPADAALGGGPAVEVLEMLSTRDVGTRPPPAVERLTAGLRTAFDQPSLA
jgi:uncharacterized protein (TIGR03083 family)